jgi:competence protein ComEA
VSALARWATAALAAVMFLSAGEGLAQTRAPRSNAAPSTVSVASSSSRPGAATAQSAPEGVVNINAATEDELRRLPLIGPSRATAIVALRTRVQRFRSADDLLRVRGIGRASLRRLRPYVSLSGETTLLARPGRSPAQRAATAP